jgi:predicted transcriptional regulator
MPKQHQRGGLGARERQIMDAIYQLGEASVAEVLAKLSDPPTYSSVRTMIRALEAKGLLRHRQVGSRYVYRPAHSREAAKRSALRHLIQTFFAGSAAGVVETILHPSVARLTDEEIERLERLIQQARHQEKGE